RASSSQYTRSLVRSGTEPMSRTTSPLDISSWSSIHHRLAGSQTGPRASTFRAMSAVFGPDGRPAQFDGTAWVSADGTEFWDGAAWQPIRRPKARPSGLVIVLAI